MLVVLYTFWVPLLSVPEYLELVASLPHLSLASGRGHIAQLYFGHLDDICQSVIEFRPNLTESNLVNSQVFLRRADRHKFIVSMCWSSVVC